MPSLRIRGWLAPLFMLSATWLLAGCAAQECDFHSQCGEGRYCEFGRCQQDCQNDFDCAPGEGCDSIGQCVPAAEVDSGAPGRDGGAPRRDAGPVVVADGGGADAGVVVGADAGPRRDAGAAPHDAGPPFTFDAGLVSTDAGPPGGPVGRGTYVYTRAAVGGLGHSIAVAFHPDGSYALVLEDSNEVHVYDWASGTALEVDVRVGGRTVRLTDLHFAPGGGYAYLVGYETSPSEIGVVIRFDDATWRAAHDVTAFTRIAEVRAGERFTGIEFPDDASGPSGEEQRPVVLSASGSAGSGFVARLRELNPATDAFEGLFVVRATAAGCDDLAFVDNEFGTWGIAIVCGASYADAKYYTEVGGIGEWRPAPAATLGNTSRIDAHPGGDYALAIGWSGMRVHRFQGGAWRPSASAPGFSTRGIWDVSFAPDGRRALVVGRTSTTLGSVLEYRHDLYAASDFTDVSIPGFTSPPYSASSNTHLQDSAFRPGCDGGLIVGGDFGAGTGLVIEFRIEGGVACR